MTEWMWPLVVLAGAVVLVVLYASALVLRRRHLSKGGGAFELSLHRAGHDEGRGWQLGLGRYVGDDLQYFRIFSLAGPRQVWSRRITHFEGQRRASELEQMALYPGHVIATVVTPEGEVELAMSEDALVAFQSWLESRPPGADWNSPRQR